MESEVCGFPSLRSQAAAADLSRIAPARGVGGVGNGLAMATLDSAQSAAVSNDIELVLRMKLNASFRVCIAPKTVFFG